jgi:hypothetical protein
MKFMADVDTDSLPDFGLTPTVGAGWDEAGTGNLLMYVVLIGAALFLLPKLTHLSITTRGGRRQKNPRRKLTRGRAVRVKHKAITLSRQSDGSYA